MYLLTSQGAQNYKLAFRSKGFCVPENLIFPALDNGVNETLLGEIDCRGRGGGGRAGLKQSGPLQNQAKEKQN